MDSPEICFEVIENFPVMIFSKDANPETRQSYQGFQYAYFNAIFDSASGFCRNNLIGQNARDHFPVDYARYFTDDRAVMDLKSRDTDQVLNLVEPWKVSKGDYVLHTRKVNLIDRYMLGTFIWADDVHMGVQEEKYRPIEPVTSTTPPPPYATYFEDAFEYLPVPVLIVNPLALKTDTDMRKKEVRRNLFWSSNVTEKEEDELLLQPLLGKLMADQDHIYERSNVVIGGSKYHLMLRPLVMKSGQQLAFLVLWPQNITAAQVGAARACTA